MTESSCLKLALERALNKTIKLKQGEKERITMAVAGVERGDGIDG
jgi:hypothetical protein